MAGVAPINPRVQFLSSAGVPLVNGTVTVYLAGTTTLSNTWQDQALTTLNTNPITLDSRGEAQVWLDSSLTYKFLLKNVAGVTQWTVDNIAGPLALVLTEIQIADYTALRAYTGGAKQVSVTGYLASAAPSGTAGLFTRDDNDTTSADNGGTIIVASNGKRWKRAVSGAVNVRWFGALGDGTTDDTTAIQAAINAVSPGKLYIPKPPGSYYLVTGLTVSNALEIVGDGWETALYSTTAAPIIIVTSAGRLSISDIKIIGSAGAFGAGGNAAQHGIHFQSNSQNFAVRRVWVYRAGGRGIFIEGAYLGSLADGQCNDCGVDGVSITGKSAAPAQVASNVTVQNWTSKTNGRYGFLVDGNTVGANQIAIDAGCFAINNTSEQLVATNCAGFSCKSFLLEIDGSAPLSRPTYEMRCNVVTGLTLENIQTTGNTDIQVQGCTGGSITDIRPNTGAGGSFVFATDNVDVLYEEVGSWTPAIEFGGATTGITYAGGQQFGRYIKLGKRIKASGYFTLTNKGSAAGNMKITGLPYTVKNIANYIAGIGACSQQYNLSGVTGQVHIEPEENTTKIRVFTSSTGSTAWLTDASCTNTTQMYFVLEYEAA